MIVRLDSTRSGDSGYLITPNKAMPWRQLVVIYLIMSGFSLTIATVFLLHGYPLVLPFSGLELIILGYALYVSAWKGGAKEVITISDGQITFESGRDFPDTTSDFQRAWTSIVLECPKIHWYPSRLLIRSHGKQVEVGRFLNEQERQGLLVELKSVLANNN